ncbi:hypothetical protein GCM10023310_53490 [Paenibacillus vulneris]
MSFTWRKQEDCGKVEHPSKAKSPTGDNRDANRPSIASGAGERYGDRAGRCGILPF